MNKGDNRSPSALSRSGKSSPSLSEKAKLSAREESSKLRTHMEALVEVDEYG